jgi:antitoxin YobK
MYDEIFQRIENDSISHYTKGTTLAQITLVQETLGILFPKSYIAFMRKFGGGTFRFAQMHSINKVTDDNGAEFLEIFEQASQNISIVAAKKLIPFADDYSGDYYCFDISRMQDDGECPVVLWLDENTTEEFGHFIAFVTSAFDASEGWENPVTLCSKS